MTGRIRIFLKSFSYIFFIIKNFENLYIYIYSRKNLKNTKNNSQNLLEFLKKKKKNLNPHGAWCQCHPCCHLYRKTMKDDSFK